ncbi:MAG: hypothetical protein ABL877_01935 [Thiobacillus sp.]
MPQSLHLALSGCQNHDALFLRPALEAAGHVVQVLITRSRQAGEPADVMITPHLAELGLMEFHRAAIAIEEGQRAAEQALPQLTALLNQSGVGGRDRVCQLTGVVSFI